MPLAERLKPLLIAAMPAVFVVLWSTGFIGAKLGLPHAEPFTFLALRFAIAVAILLPFALLAGTQWPGLRAGGHVAVVGLLVHASYLGGVFAAIDRGLPAGVAALIVAMQPLITAVLIGPMVGERVRPRQWLGFALGLAGVLLVLSEKLAGSAVDRLFEGFDLAAVGLCFLALVAISLGTLYQKRHVAHVDLKAGTTIQYAAAGLVTFAAALASGETMEVVWATDFVIALTWLVVVLSLGAVSLLMLLIRLGAAARTASLFYLVPPCTAVVAWLLFDERLGPVALLGMAVAAAGVALVMRQPRATPAA